MQPSRDCNKAAAAVSHEVFATGTEPRERREGREQMMARKIGLSLAVTAVLSLAMASTASADVYRVRATEDVVFAAFSNIPGDQWEGLPAGDYFVTDLIAATQLALGSEEYEDNFVCLKHEEFSVDDAGESTWLGGVFACGPATTLSIDRRLETAQLTASLPVVDCAAWDEETGECLEPIELGTIEIDLSFEGTGRIQRQHSASSGGTTGEYTSVSHATGTARAATPSGIVTFDGGSLIDGATSVDGSLLSASGGWVEVSLGG